MEGGSAMADWVQGKKGGRDVNKTSSVDRHSSSAEAKSSQKMNK